jgi:hypothetical protein
MRSSGDLSTISLDITFRRSRSLHRGDPGLQGRKDKCGKWFLDDGAER